MSAETGKLRRGLGNLLGLGARLRSGRSEVGQTPFEVVHQENKWRLLRYQPRSGGPRYRRPILMIPSLINRYYVLDLAPGRSVVEYLASEGHDVFVVDWGTPGPEDRYLSFDDICQRYIGRAVRVSSRLGGSRDVHLLGYCLGGTLAAIHTAANPEHIASFTALAAPVSFEDEGLLARWTRTPSFDVDALARATGNVPWQLMQAAFHLLRPTLTLAKGVSVADRCWDDEFVDGFVATEVWGNDNVSFPGECYRRYIGELYRENRLVRGEMVLAGRPARLEAIRCPSLVITFEHDNIVPSSSALPLLDHLGATDVEHLHLRGGHVGAVVSRKAAERLWPVMAAFWAARDGGEAGRDEPTAAGDFGCNAAAARV